MSEDPVIHEVARRTGRGSNEVGNLARSKWHLRLLLRLSTWLNEHSGSKRWK